MNNLEQLLEESDFYLDNNKNIITPNTQQETENCKEPHGGTAVNMQ